MDALARIESSLADAVLSAEASGAHRIHQKTRGVGWRFIRAILLRSQRAGGTRQKPRLAPA